MENLTEFQELESNLELLDWNNSFGIYSKKEYKKKFKVIIERMEILENDITK